jgi:anti-anti-sigma factor
MSEPVGEVIRVDVERRDQGQVILHVAGDVDMTTAPELDRHISTVVTNAKVVVVNLLAVTFFGSPGLSVLVAARGKAEAAGCARRVVATQNAVIRPVRITGLQGSLELFDTVADALHD